MTYCLRLLAIMLSLAVTPIYALSLTQGLQEKTLNNGLKVIVKPDTRAPIVVSQVWYRIGSSYEHKGITGISHVVEHMMFKGTPTYPGDAFTKQVTQNGGTFNAFTSTDATAYFEEFSADKLALSFKLEADRMRHLSLDENAFKKEIQVVMEERRMRTDDNPHARTYERLLASAFLALGYHHPIIGWMQDLKQMHINDLKTWYQKWYAPNNAIVVVVGDVKPAEVFKLAAQYFGPLKAEKLPLVKQQDIVPQLGEREVNVSLPAKVPYLLMAYHVPVVNTAPNSIAPYALDVLATLLGGSDSSLLAKHLVRGQQIAVSAGTSYDPFDRLPTLFILSATPAAGTSLAQLQKALLAQINNLQVKPISAAMLKRVKTQLLASKIYSQDSPFYQAMLIGHMEAIGLSWQNLDSYFKHIQDVTPKNIQQAAQRYLVTKGLTVAKLHPQPLDKSAKEAKAS